MTGSKSPTLCTAIQQDTRWIWSELKKSNAVDHKLGEESLTDFFILKLLQQKPFGFCIRTFTRPQESVTGSDWEWWLGSRSRGWLGMRVQAKTINVASGCYEQLHYIPRSGTPQVEQLISDASHHRLIPIYCLYTYWDTARGRTLPRFTGKRLRKTEYGVSWVSATAVRDNKSRNIDLHYWFPKLVPLAKLFCVDLSAYPSFAEAILNNLMLANIINGDDEGGVAQRWIHAELPDYIPRQRPPNSLVDDFDDQDQNLLGIVLIEAVTQEG